MRPKVSGATRNVGDELHSEYFPLGVGLRVYPASAGGRAPGFYIDAAPVAHVSHIRSYSEPDWVDVIWGYEAGFGVRFAAWGRSRGEIGAMVYHIDGINNSLVFPSRSSGRSVGGLGVYMMQVSFGFGD